nr:hypothetical protein [uncultured Cohaesibacter sp.]
MVTQTIVPPTLSKIISIADSFDEKVYARLAELIQLPTSTDPTDEVIESFCADTKVDEVELRYFLSFLAFLIAQTADANVSDLKTTIVPFLQENGEISEERVDILSDNLIKLLYFREIQFAAAKKERLRRGFLPNIIGISSFVDIRSDFKNYENGELTGEIVGEIYTIQLSIKTNSITDGEKAIVVQVQDEDLDKIEKDIARIRKKIQILKSRNDD